MDSDTRPARRLKALVMLAGLLLAAGILSGVVATPAQAFTCTDTGCTNDAPPPDPGSPTGCGPTEVGGVEGGSPDIFENWSEFFAGFFPFERYPEFDAPLLCEGPVTPPPASQLGAFDVALGDSYMSGEGDVVSNFHKFPPNPKGQSCDVSGSAWSAEVFDTGVPGGYENWSCSGAVLADISTQVTQAAAAGKKTFSPGNPGSSFAGLGVSTDLVQVDGGGNDLSFADKLTCAVLHSSMLADKTRSQDSTGAFCIPLASDLTPMVTNLVPKWTALFKQISAAAPNAFIQVVGYPILFPGPQPRRECDTSITATDQISIDGDVVAVDKGIHQAVTAAQALGINVSYVDLSTGLFTAGPCISDTSPRRGLNIPGHNSNGTFKGDFHPNATGDAALADTFLRMANAGFPAANVDVTPVTPADGTLLLDNATDEVYIAAGGALLPFGGTADLRAAGYANTPIVPTQSVQIATLTTANPAPVDGTLLREAGTGVVYKIKGWTKIAVTTAANTPGAITVSGFTLSAFATLPSASSGATSPGAVFDPATGRMEVYYNSGGQLAQSAYVPSTGTWIHSILGGAITGQPSALFDAATGNLEIYYNSGGQLTEKAYIPSTGTWVNVGVIAGAITGSPTALLDTGDGNLEIYYNSGGQLTETAWVPSQGKFVQVGAIAGAITGSPSVLLDPGDGNLEIYYNSGGQLTETAYVFSSGWVHVGAIGTTITGSPRALYDPGSGNLEIYYNSSGQLTETAYVFSAAGWIQATPGDAISGDPAPVFDPTTGNVEIYYNSGGHFARNVLNSANGIFAGQTLIGGAISADPAPVFNPATANVEVYFNSGGQLVQDAFNPATGTFSGVSQIGGTIG